MYCRYFITKYYIKITLKNNTESVERSDGTWQFLCHELEDWFMPGTYKVGAKPAAIQPAMQTPERNCKFSLIFQSSKTITYRGQHCKLWLQPEYPRQPSLKFEVDVNDDFPYLCKIIVYRFQRWRLQQHSRQQPRHYSRSGIFRKPEVRPTPTTKTATQLRWLSSSWTFFCCFWFLLYAKSSLRAFPENVDIVNRYLERTDGHGKIIIRDYFILRKATQADKLKSIQTFFSIQVFKRLMVCNYFNY